VKIARLAIRHIACCRELFDYAFQKQQCAIGYYKGHVEHSTSIREPFDFVRSLSGFQMEKVNR
jgi:hypothetical protein